MNSIEVKRKKLLALLHIPGNERCADCNAEGPEWASISFGVFLCTTCASIHRQLGAHISRVKSIKLDNWDESQIQIMKEIGNKAAKAIYEKHVPVYYRRPKPSDPQVLLEQWIWAKYERKEFTKQLDTPYSKGFLEGYLWKRGKKDSKFYLRKFVLSAIEGTLRYFVKEHHKEAKAVIPLASLNATFSQQKTNQPYSLQITFVKEGGTRSIFVYSEYGKDIIDWFMAIRGAKLYHLHVAYPTTPTEDLIPFLTRDFTIEGFLWKTGPRVGDAYKKRWFILDDRKLMYLESPMDAYPKGEIFIGEKNEGYAVRVGVPPGFKYHMFGFTLVTPGRTWLMGAESDEDRDKWLDAIEALIKRPAAPQDYSGISSEMRNSFPSRNRNSRGKFFSF